MGSLAAGNVTKVGRMTDVDDQNKLAAKIIDHVFGGIVKTDPESFVKAYLQDVHTPVEVPSVLGGTTWTSVSGLDSYASEDQVISASKDHDWLYPKESIDSLEQLNSLIQRSDFMQGSRSFDAKDVYRSDDVARSFSVFHSRNIIDSNNITDCNWIWNSEFLLGCTRSGESTFSIGLTEGVQCSGSYRVYGSRAITNSFFIKNCYDLQNSIFCSHLKNKQYCVANMQYTKEEYEVLKKKIFEWLF